MTDAELRRLVQDAVARHLGGRAPAAVAETRPVAIWRGHPSHGQYLIVNAGDACVIEPGVTCNHCGYCKSHGH
jgi:hypothetical protein